jgi:hypothetical protein
MKQPLHQALPRHIPTPQAAAPRPGGPAETRGSLEARRGPNAAGGATPTRRLRPKGSPDTIGGPPGPPALAQSEKYIWYSTGCGVCSIR